MMSMPLSSRSSSSSSDSPAVPPPNSWRKVSPKCWLMTWNASWKRSREALSILRIAESSSEIESTQVLALRGQEGVALLVLLGLLHRPAR
jgi:hypothetical protein